VSSTLIKPIQVVANLSDEALHGIAKEIREWSRTGKTGGVKIAELNTMLMRDSGMHEDGISQVTEALVLNEVCDRWLSASIYLRKS
jgi:hypothetical protein